MEVLRRVGRGKYRADIDLARKIMEEGTTLGVENVTQARERDTSLITISHHFRINKPVPLTEDEYDKIARYLWSKDPIIDHVNGIYLEAYPTGKRDRSHAVRIKTMGAIFHITFSYKKRIAQVMVYPKKKEMWTFYAKQLFGKGFVERAVKIGVSSHFGFNLSEVSKVLFEGEKIKVTINKSDFGASGDVEFEGVSMEGGELGKELIEGRLKTVGEIVDQYEVLKRRLDEITVELHYLNTNEKVTDLKKRLDELEQNVKEIKNHVIQHTRYLNLKLAAEYHAHDFPQNSSSTEGYA